jgi:hypothetical protein
LQLITLLEAAPPDLRNAMRPLARRLEKAVAAGNKPADEISDMNSTSLRIDMLDQDRIPMMPALPASEAD